MFYIMFKTSNNAGEYEELIAGLKTTLSLGVCYLRVKEDSQLVINQVNGRCACNKAHLAAYLMKVKKIELSFDAIEFKYIPREENTEADELSTLASARAPPPSGVFHNRVLRPSAEPSEQPRGRIHESGGGLWARGRRHPSARGSEGRELELRATTSLGGQRA